MVLRDVGGCFYHGVPLLLRQRGFRFPPLGSGNLQPVEIRAVEAARQVEQGGIPARPHVRDDLTDDRLRARIFLQ